ncbi:hypothetical protein F5146DRAFT_1000133 [Armillaria mellea]|nr:hypothetical protein F5146DRAFT_1000133 [Armillaria mellea]
MITLYDLPSKVADSPGTMITWRARYCLNLKNLPYQTVYVETPDIAALAKKIGAAPTSLRPDRASHKYTIPHHSRPLHRRPAYLDKTYPSSGLVLIPPGTLALQLAFTDTVEAAFEHLRLPLFYAGFITKLNDRSAVPMRTKFGDKLKAPEGDEREKMWATTTENLGKMNKWFEGGEVDFVMGNKPCFADTVISGYLWLIRSTVGRESEEWKDIATWHDGRWRKHMDYFKSYETGVRTRI